LISYLKNLLTNNQSIMNNQQIKIDRLGIVVIGRNEGERLHKCLLSVLGKAASIVYVDSGSTDNSVAMARSLGIEVIELDLSIPFTAARARNQGFFYLIQNNPQIELVQFVDGDCEVISGWLENAVAKFEDRSNLAIICGRRRESFPEKSIYNRLCDLEWNTPIGETEACGGDFMVRVTAFQQVEGFNPKMIAGEEPELCLRLRQQEWKILRIDVDMTWHDAQMFDINQWWQRAVRAGHAYAEGSWLHRRSLEGYWVKESRSIWLWGLIFPLLILLTLLPSKGVSALAIFIYALMTFRIALSLLKQGLNIKDAWVYGLHCVLSKFPQVQGQIRFHFNRLLGKQNNLIEYKSINSAT
jgi:glycosyltransferase involved in cell wall biosynthesis